MIVLKLVIFILFIASHHCRLPDKVYCVNPECNVPISKAKTILGYNSGDKDLISFRGNADALIYMKSAGSNPDLWYAKIDEKSGFVNSRFLRENKIYVKNPQHILPVEVRRKQNEVVPDKVQQAHEVFEGTTIYSTPPAVVAEETTTLPPNTATYEATTPTIVNQEPIETVNSHPSEEIINPETKSQVSQSASETPVPPSYISNVPEFPQPSIDSSVSNQDNIPQDTVQNPVPIENSTPSPVIHNIPEYSSPPSETGINSNENQDIEPVGPTDISPGQQEVPVLQNPTENVYQEIASPVVPTNIAPNPQDVPIQLNPSESVNQVLPPTESISPLQTLSSKNEEISLSSTIEVPVKTDHLQKTLTPPQQAIDNLESNANQINSLSNIDTPLPHDSSESNVLDKSIPSQHNTIPEVPQPHDNSMFGSMYNQDGNTLNKGLQEPLPETSEIITEGTTLPSTESSQSIMTEPQETTTNTYPPHTITEETIVPKFSYLTTETTVPPEPNPESNIDVPNIPTTDIPVTQSQEPSDILGYTSESAPIIDTTPTPHIDEYIATSEPELNEMPSNTPADEPRQEENMEGVLSSIFSSISSMWSSTETPPAENIFNTESVQEPETANLGDDGGFSFINYFISTYNSVMGTKDETKALFQSAGETCFTDEYCDGTTKKNNRLLTFLLTTASSVLLFTLGYYYLDIRRQDSKLIGKINALQRDLLFSNKECEILKEELSTTKNKLAGIEDNSFGMDDMVQSLKEEINEMKAQNARLRNSLDDNEKLLRVSENTAGELQNTLGEVENTLSELLGERANAEEQIAELNGKIQAFEEELISVTRDRDNFQLKYVSAETTLEEAKKQLKLLDDLNEKLKEARNTIELQKHEISALKDAMREMKSGSGNVDIGSLIDHTEIKAKLSKALEEKKSFESKYQIEHKERERLAEELNSTRESMSTTSQQATEAQTRLEVLGKYFQEREGELMKELSTKESLWLSKQGESASTVEKMELLQQEIQRYKEKCDALTLELAEQESTRRTAVGEVEARAHAAWLEARAARRDADAARDDAAALRRKLASITAADGAVSPHRQVSSPLEATEVGVPPALPPMPFLPPLLPPLPRPPPLGRLPSPHPPRYNDRRYSPDSRYSPESRYSPGTRYLPETVRYSPRDRHSAYSPRSRRRSRERYESGRGSRPRAPPDTETEYNSDSPSREPRRRRRYSRHSGPSSGSGCSSESDK